MNKKVADILLRKGSNITTVQPGTSVLEALRIMADQNIGSVMVMDDGRYQGIMTERDYSRKIILKGKVLPIHLYQRSCPMIFPGLPPPTLSTIACN
ncbi:CBS domain-containing protein [Paraflavitalea speifideaquila]|uniref:CBS domain-containing protein n=1 Tax=Paraflavitalea speifideaquila TaxID=3076558 RepID=UPI0028F0D5B7|nr:CBS domain-containing protein [Paraflavitalea speifideiaquila]